MKKATYGTALLAVVLLLWFRAGHPVRAAAEFVSVRLSVSVELEGTEPETPDSFQIRLVPSGDGIPMPEEGEELLTLQGESQGSFSEIRYTQPGIYQYTLFQLPGNASCSYDTAQFHLTVTVVNGGNGLECAAVLYQDNENNKLELPVFHNKYPEKPRESESNPPGVPQEHPPGTPQNTPANDPARVVVPTGVEDYRLLYAAGMLISLAVAGTMLRRRKQRGDSDEENGGKWRKMAE